MGRESLSVVPLPLVVVGGISCIRLRCFDGAVVLSLSVVPLGAGPYRVGGVAVVVIVTVVIIMIIVQVGWPIIHAGVTSYGGRVILVDEALKVGLHVTQPEMFFPDPFIDDLGNLTEALCMTALVPRCDATNDE